MKLKDFISNTLFEIQEGVQEAQRLVKKADTSGVINPVWKSASEANKSDIREVQFDVAVTVIEKTGGKAGGAIKVMGIGIGADISGGGENSYVSRIQFSIPVIPPMTVVKDEV
ncbi:hypothetical protein QWY82_16380 [Simiduia curdlanivorans]|uniref:Uncharacterized protein n=1 Tax=Simiduia curdlanivorans TaxID=1492769 RepID=A0ABV8UZ96_9GAMM|nr:hypothetical protein [Simiduia curdlanivorans]MDN3640373.1 hypothetical protein [Simiduia curdlanivorans]